MIATPLGMSGSMSLGGSDEGNSPNARLGKIPVIFQRESEHWWDTFSFAGLQ